MDLNILKSARSERHHWPDPWRSRALFQVRIWRGFIGLRQADSELCSVTTWIARLLCPIVGARSGQAHCY
jgi:hypothetical protein